MNVLLLASHSVAEYDDIRMLTDLGYDVFCPGGYQNPSDPGESHRPALPDAPYHPELIELCEQVRAANGEPGPNIDWAKARLHPDIIDWADVIIVHHFPERWIGGQWEEIKHKRVIWRTCGQSSPDGSLERFMAQFRYKGLQIGTSANGVEIVRYSPNERILPDFAGEDALIRFGKYPDDYGPWVGDELVVGNITQHMKQRGDACGYPFWEAATEGLPVAPAGPGSEVMRGGLGALDYPAMLDYLSHLRCYLYTGTQPASYTLGLMEAMLAGVPVVSIGPGKMWMPALFEGPEIVWPNIHHDGHVFARSAYYPDLNEPDMVRSYLRQLLENLPPVEVSNEMRQRAIDLFDVATVGPQWKAFLG